MQQLKPPIPENHQQNVPQSVGRKIVPNKASSRNIELISNMNSLAKQTNSERKFLSKMDINSSIRESKGLATQAENTMDK